MDKINFEDLPSQNSPINAKNLNQVQTNIETALGTKVDVGTILYKDETGTTGDVTLNEDATNYEEIEVFGYRVGRPFYIKVKGNQEYFLFNQIRFVDDMFYFYTKEYSIEGNILKVEYAKRMNIMPGETPAIGGDENIFITKVVGHNKKT